MRISKHSFTLKYHTRSWALIEQGRMEYIERYGYEKTQQLSPESRHDLEYLDAIECLINETRNRIDEAIYDPVFDCPERWTKGAIDDKEERLVPLLCLMDRLQLQISFAKAKLVQFVDHSVQCIANWAKSLLSMCDKVRDVYWVRANELRQAMALQLNVRA